MVLAILPATINMAHLCALTPQGRARLEHSLALYRADIAPQIIVSGGETITGLNEADLMHSYLLAAGLTNDAILRERRSLNTYQNMRYTAILADSLGLRRLHIVTSPYHTLRSSCVADLFSPEHSISYGDDPTLSPAYFDQWVGLYHVGREYAALFYYGLRYPELRTCWQRLYDGT
ncbi:MAG: YdcF family protein [Candidatus Latescibacterota bacterium]